MAKPKTNKYWVLLEGVLQRFYGTITKTKMINKESVKKQINDTFVSVPQTLEEVPEHSEMTALEHCQHDIAERKYLRIREGLHDADDLEALVERVNVEKVAKGKEASMVTMFKALPKDIQQQLLDSLDEN